QAISSPVETRVARSWASALSFWPTRSVRRSTSRRVDEMSRVTISSPRCRGSPARCPIRAIVALLRPECEARAIALNVDMEEAFVDADESQIEQVVINVMRNAIDAVDRNGAINIALHHQELTIP